MIKAVVGNLIIFGLSEENIKRLKENKPIVFDATKLGMEGRHICILYGETEESIVADLQDAEVFPPQAARNTP